LREALRSGHTFASNGPLLGLEIAGAHPGDTVHRNRGGEMPYRIAMRSPVPIEHLELVQNGRVLRRFTLSNDRRTFDEEGTAPIDAGGWVVLRTYNDGADPGVLDLYPYATTSPIYLDLPGGPSSVREDAAYFAAWMDRVLSAATERNDYNNDRERNATLTYLRRARDYYRRRAGS
jgi:hypothetical protein